MSFKDLCGLVWEAVETLTPTPRLGDADRIRRHLRDSHNIALPKVLKSHMHEIIRFIMRMPREEEEDESEVKEPEQGDGKDQGSGGEDQDEEPEQGDGMEDQGSGGEEDGSDTDVEHGNDTGGGTVLTPNQKLIDFIQAAQPEILACAASVPQPTSP